jgi:hypothetical protein
MEILPLVSVLRNDTRADNSPPLEPSSRNNYSTSNHTSPTMSGWEVRFSNSKQLPYFFNAASGQSVWEKPAELSDDQVAQLPGAKYLSGGGGGDAGKPKQVRSSHILAKHAGSRRPSSWRQVGLFSNTQAKKDEGTDV